MSFYVQKVLDSKLDLNHLFTGKLEMNRLNELLHSLVLFSLSNIISYCRVIGQCIVSTF